MSATDSVARGPLKQAAVQAVQHARDVREGAAWTRAQTLKNDVLYALIHAAIFATRPLPAPLLRAFGMALGLLALVVFPRARRIATANAARIAPHASRLVLRNYIALGAHLGDAAASLRGDPLDTLPIDEASLECLRDPRGVVFASAHLGPWERVAATLVARGVPLTTLARESYDPRLDPLYDRLRGGRGVGVIYRGHPSAPMRIVRTLRNGGVLGAPMDLRSRVPSIDVPFLGRLASTPVGPARIALRTGARVVVGTVATASDGVMRITCSRIPTHDLPPHRPSAERELTARINAELSRRIEAMPEQWPLMHDRFA